MHWCIVKSDCSLAVVDCSMEMVTLIALVTYVVQTFVKLVVHL
jgi:hypothetical protein